MSPPHFELGRAVWHSMSERRVHQALQNVLYVTEICIGWPEIRVRCATFVLSCLFLHPYHSALVCIGLYIGKGSLAQS